MLFDVGFCTVNVIEVMGLSIIAWLSSFLYQKVFIDITNEESRYMINRCCVICLLQVK